MEEREIFASAELKSPDGKVTYVTASAQFVQLDPQGRGKILQITEFIDKTNFGN